MPKCRPNLDDVTNRTPTGLKVSGNGRRALESRNATAKYGSRYHDATPLGVDPGKQAFDRHAALLDDSRLSRSGNGIQRAMAVRKLQRDYGTRYVQRLIEHISRRSLTRIQAKSAAGPAWDKKIRNNPGMSGI